MARAAIWPSVVAPVVMPLTKKRISSAVKAWPLRFLRMISWGRNMGGLSRKTRELPASDAQKEDRHLRRQSPCSGRRVQATLLIIASKPARIGVAYTENAPGFPGRLSPLKTNKSRGALLFVCLNAVGNPDVFDLASVGEDGTAARLPGVVPVAALGAADPGALEGLGGEAFDFGAALCGTVVAPDGV